MRHQATRAGGCVAVAALTHALLVTVSWLYRYAAQYPCTADDYDILQEIGVGAFATVYRATVNVTGVSLTHAWTDTPLLHCVLRCRAVADRFGATARCAVSQEEVAIKIIDLEQFNTNWDEIRVSRKRSPQCYPRTAQLDTAAHSTLLACALPSACAVQREIQIMSLLHHPNVVKIKTSFIVASDLWIVMPLLQAGSCASLMKLLAPSGFKDEALIATILRETLQGLMYFHKDGRIHRDLKAGNILIGAHGEVQLADFGVAGTLMENGDRKKNRQTFTGTPCWMAPEVMEHTNGYDEKADIWSFGITAMELGFGRAPYAKYQPMKVMLLTISEEPPTPEIYKDNSYQFSKNYASLIAKCLRRDTKKRPTAKKLMEHKFFKVARGREYIIEKLVSRMPPRGLGSAGVERVHVCKEKTLIDAAKVEKSKPVSVGSWSFDKGELQEMKQKALEEKSLKAGERESKSAADREQAVENSYHAHSDSDASDGEHAHPHPQLDELYTQPIHPSELAQQGKAGSHDSNVAVNAELLVDEGLSKRREVDVQHAPIPSFSPLHRQGSQTAHQEGRFTVSEEDEPQQQQQQQRGHERIVNGHKVHMVAVQSGSGGQAVFHNGAAQEAEEHVGRFSIRDEDD